MIRNARVKWKLMCFPPLISSNSSHKEVNVTRDTNWGGSRVSCDSGATCCSQNHTTVRFPLLSWSQTVKLFPVQSKCPKSQQMKWVVVFQSLSSPAASLLVQHSPHRLLMIRPVCPGTSRAVLSARCLLFIIKVIVCSLINQSTTRKWV